MGVGGWLGLVVLGIKIFSREVVLWEERVWFF